MSAVGYLIIVLSLLPLIRLDFWFFRVFEYPRIQKLTINVLVAAALFTFWDFESLPDKILIALLILNTGYLSFQVFPFTFLARKQIIKTSNYQPDKCLSLYIGNVCQHNDHYKEYLQMVINANADVIMLVETDKKWADYAHEKLSATYPNTMLVPLENTYGMILYSRLELTESKVRYLVEDDVPSVHTCINLPSGDIVRMHGLHPTPPVPGENPRSTERDKEILMVAKAAKTSKYPVIVAGDLNDVAWSYTTELFSRISGLLDPRRGRGFFNTFHAKYPGLRFPLDHIFVSNDFTLVEMQRLDNCGSDHFPMYIKLQYEPEAKKSQEEPQADQDDLETAEEKINEPT